APYPTGGEIGLRKAAIARAQLESLGRPSSLVVPEAESQIDPNAPAIRLKPGQDTILHFGGPSALDVMLGRAEPTEAGSTPLESPGLFGGLMQTLEVSDKPRQDAAGLVGESAIKQHLGTADAGDLL